MSSLSELGQMRGVLDSLEQPVIAADGRGEIFLANPAAVRTLRRPMTDLVGANVADVLHVPRRSYSPRVGATERFLEIVAPIGTAGGATERDLTINDTSPVDVRATITELTGDEPGWVFTLGSKRSDGGGSLANDQRLRMFDLSADLLVVVGRDYTILDVNGAWAALGHRREDLIGSNVIDVVHPDDRERAAEEVTDLMSHRTLTVGYTHRNLHADGSYRWFRWMGATDTVHDTLIAIGTDVSDLVAAHDRLEAMLRSARAHEAVLIDEREQAELASSVKDEFLANMSHELRTPLNSVIGFADLLIENTGGNLTKQDLSYLERIHRNGLHLLSLIEDVLDVTKLDSTLKGRVDLIELAEVVKDAVEQSEGAARDTRLTFDYDIPPDILPIEADPKRLLQVLINLLGNALKYSEEGTVLVRVVSEDSSAHAARIDVIDEGPGIPPSSLDAVFEAFWQGRSTAGHGSGLGLTIARSMCRAMGFELSVDSIEGKGATFSILLSDDATQPDHVPLADLPRRGR